MKEKLSLKDWINREGVKTIAKRFSINESTVRHWRRGHCLPTAKQMHAIKRLTKGEVSIDEMVDSHFGKGR